MRERLTGVKEKKKEERGEGTRAQLTYTMIYKDRRTWRGVRVLQFLYFE